MSIRLSPKHGVNPAIPKCFYCHQDKNEILLLGYIQKDKEAPKNAVWDEEPCTTCQEYMKQGIILISVKESSDMSNPNRTGGFWVIKDEAIKRFVQDEKLLNHILKKRTCYIPNEVALLWRLPNCEQLIN